MKFEFILEVQQTALLGVVRNLQSCPLVEMLEDGDLEVYR